jgi:hypothetical protein
MVDAILEPAQELVRRLDSPGVAYVTDEEVVFYGIGRTAEVHQALIRAFERHGNRHPLAAGELCPADERAEALAQRSRQHLTLTARAPRLEKGEDNVSGPSPT